MSTVTQAFREHHRELANQLADYGAAFAQGKSGARPQEFATFLKNELVPHAAGEEAHLYPVMDEIVRARGKATATMSIDHEYIQNYVAEIEAAARALADATPDAEKSLRARLAQ